MVGCVVTYDIFFGQFWNNEYRKVNKGEGRFPLELTLQPHLWLQGQSQKFAKIQEKVQEKSGLVSPHQQNLVHQGLSWSRSQPWGWLVFLHNQTTWGHAVYLQQTSRRIVATSCGDKLTRVGKFTDSPQPNLQSVLPFQFWWNSWKKKRIKYCPVHKLQFGQCWNFGSHHMTKSTALIFFVDIKYGYSGLGFKII